MIEQDEVDQGLVLVYASREGTSYTDYSLDTDKINDLCLNKQAKKELVRTLQRLALNIDEKYGLGVL